MTKKVQKIGSDLNIIIKSKLEEKFNLVAEEIKEIIMEEYDSELVGVVTDRNSKTNPELYRDEFIERLNKFTYMTIDGNQIKLIVPDMENFDFSGRLEVVESIMEGVAGLYVEMNEDDYKAVFNKPPVNTKPVDGYIAPKDRIYLVRYSNRIKRVEKELKKDFVKYPFSNTPPIKILDEAERFVNANINQWLKDTIDMANKELVNGLKGVK